MQPFWQCWDLAHLGLYLIVSFSEDLFGYIPTTAMQPRNSGHADMLIYMFLKGDTNLIKEGSISTTLSLNCKHSLNFTCHAYKTGPRKQFPDGQAQLDVGNEVVNISRAAKFWTLVFLAVRRRSHCTEEALSLHFSFKLGF